MMEHLDTLKNVSDLITQLYNKTRNEQTKRELEPIREKLFNAMTSILDRHHSLTAENQTLKDVVTAHENFEEQAEGYMLKMVAQGVFLHEYQESHNPEMPTHYACPKCYAEKKISILQSMRPGGPVSSCPACASEFYTYKPDSMIYYG